MNEQNIPMKDSDCHIGFLKTNYIESLETHPKNIRILKDKRMEKEPHYINIRVNARAVKLLKKKYLIYQE